MRRDTQKLYIAWKNMKARCRHPRITHGESKYVNISYCQEWEQYEPFEQWAMENGYNDSLYLDRINNTLDYSPNNCRWVTNKVNSNNRSDNRLITYNNKTQTISQWADEIGMNYKTLISRLNKPHWTLDEVFKAPKGHNLDYGIKRMKRDKKGRLIGYGVESIS